MNSDVHNTDLIQQFKCLSCSYTACIQHEFIKNVVEILTKVSLADQVEDYPSYP